MKHTTFAFKQITASALLALALLGAQSAAMLHWLSHSIEATIGASAADAASDVSGAGCKPDPGGLAAAHRCDACLAFSALGAGAAAAEFAAPPVLPSPPLVLAADFDARPTMCRLAFRSRAPPVLI